MMVIALFEHRLRSDIDAAEWEQAFGRMVSLASATPGFGSINGYAGQDGSGLAVVRFESEAAMQTRRAHPEHTNGPTGSCSSLAAASSAAAGP
jgi:heme-degrading monooxygenase HmoA